MDARLPTLVHPERVRPLRDGIELSGPVVYWMSREQRVDDNWALLFAQELALEAHVPLVVAFCLVPGFAQATRRHYEFMLRGLVEVQATLAGQNIGFELLVGEPARTIFAFLKGCQARTLVTDFSPLRVPTAWHAEVAERLDIPCLQVDAHNIVPVWAASVKQEYGAYTLRPKIHRALPQYLQPFPKVRRHPYPWPASLPLDWKALLAALNPKDAGPLIDWVVPGEKAARGRLKRFVEEGLAAYPEARNDPNQRGQSDLSPHLHFGQLAPQRVALDVRASDAPDEAKEAFLEELIVRRELSDNLCFYNPAYDSPAVFPPWAVKTLAEHSRDPRLYVYSLEQLEAGQTHDDLWNAAQQEMVNRGKMHGYLRMYWAKKILEWTPSPERAMEIAIELNDRYELDGRDPNGYAGIAWSIGGVHDRAWFERPVFGKIRYMSYGGCQRKFDVKAYVWEQARHE